MTPWRARPRVFLFVVAALSARAARPGIVPEPRVTEGADSCPDLHAWAQRSVAEQLAPWSETGYTEEMVEAARRQEPVFRGRTTITVGKGTVYGDNQPWARYMRRAVKNWPFAAEELQDLDFVVASASESDSPTQVKEDTDVATVGPIFSNARNEHFLDLMMPVAQRPQFDTDKFEKARAESLLLARGSPWKSRKDTTVWRGGAGCSIGCGRRGSAFYPLNHVDQCHDDNSNLNHHNFSSTDMGYSYGCGDGPEEAGLWRNHARMQLVQQSIDRGDECGFDARFTSLNGHEHIMSRFINTSAFMGDFVTDEETTQHRYVVHVGNNGYADRSWRMFALGCTVLLVDDGWREWYFDLLEPNVHYIPIKPDSSDLCEKLEWAREHPEEAEAIAQRGLAFAEHCMDLNLVDLYVAEMMRQLGRLWAKGKAAAL